MEEMWSDLCEINVFALGLVSENVHQMLLTHEHSDQYVVHFKESFYNMIPLGKAYDGVCKNNKK